MIKLEDIKKKYGFMYEIDDKVYFIGMGIFEMCTSSCAKYYFDEYRKRIHELGRENILPYHLEDNEVDALIYFFRKVKAYSNIREDEKIAENQKKIEDFLYSLNEGQKKALLEQLEDYIHVFWYYNRNS